MFIHDLVGTEQNPTYQQLAAENLDRQYSFLRSATIASLALGQPMLSIEVIKALNYHAVACLHGNPGEFRTWPVHVGDPAKDKDAFQPPLHIQVPPLMQMFTNYVNRVWDQTDDVTLAAYVLWRLNFIHPFINGNGRTARAACHFVLCLKAGGWLPGETILPELIRQNRPEYVARLKEVDASLAGGALDLTPLHGFLTGLLDVQLRSSGPAPEAPAEPVSMPGDIWLLGRHRLICGDSTNAETVGRLLGGAQPHLMVTDPPYGVEYSAGWRNEAMPEKNDPNRWKDGSGRDTGAVMNDDNVDWSEAWALFLGDVAYVWHAGNKAHLVAASLEASGLEIRAQIIWAKNQLVISRGHYHPQHEPLWYVVRKGSTGHWHGDRKQATLWSIDKPHKSETGHSTQKPVECMKRPMENNSKAGDAVYDPFVGSGTSIIAAEMTGRRCFAIELNPAYVDVSLLRWEAFSGSTARLEATGQTFDEVRDERATRS